MEVPNAADPSKITVYTQDASFYNRFGNLTDSQKRFVVLILHLVDNIYEKEKHAALVTRVDLNVKFLALKREMLNLSEYEIFKMASQDLKIPGGTGQLMHGTSQVVEQFKDTSDTHGARGNTNCKFRLFSVLTQINETLNKYFKSLFGAPEDNKCKDVFLKLIKNANDQAVEKFIPDPGGLTTPEAQLAVMQFLATCGINRSPFSADPDAFASFFGERNAAANKKRVLNDFARSFLALENVSQVVKETHAL
jgi:hypothetical protein